MFTSDQLEILMKEAMAGLSGQDQKTGGKNPKGRVPQLSPAQAIVVAAILGGVLRVTSVLVDANQNVQIVLSGSFLKNRNESELDKVMAQIGTMSFDEVLKAMVGRLR